MWIILSKRLVGGFLIMKNKSKKVYIYGVLIVCVVMFVTFFALFYMYGSKKAKPQPDIIDDKNPSAYHTDNEESPAEQTKLPPIQTEPHVDDREQLQQVSVNEDKTKSSTKFLFKTYYTKDDYTEEKYTQPDYNMINCTREQIEGMFPDYQLIKFSSEEVVFRKEEETGGKEITKYFVREYNNMIGIFYAEDYETKGEENLKEIVNTPVNTLNEEEQERLRKGFYILEEELYPLLQEYTS